MIDKNWPVYHQVICFMFVSVFSL